MEEILNKETVVNQILDLALIKH